MEGLKRQHAEQMSALLSEHLTIEENLHRALTRSMDESATRLNELHETASHLDNTSTQLARTIADLNNHKEENATLRSNVADLEDQVVQHRTEIEDTQAALEESVQAHDQTRIELTDMTRAHHLKTEAWRTTLSEKAALTSELREKNLLIQDQQDCLDQHESDKAEAAQAQQDAHAKVNSILARNVRSPRSQ